MVSWLIRSPKAHIVRRLIRSSRRDVQASSLAPACTTLKHNYDTCFNHWFSSYLLLVSPPLPLGQSGQIRDGAAAKRDQQIAAKKTELESKCGATYQSYTACLKVSASPALVSLPRQCRATVVPTSQKPTAAADLLLSSQAAIAEKEGLSEMLETARKEEPLAGWGGIKVVAEEDL